VIKMSIKTNSYIIFASLLISLPAAAAGFPERPVRLVVPFAAGAAQDIMGRVVAQRLTEAWGQQVVVDNRAGAGSSIGVELVARAQPDGYTLLFANEAMAINATLSRNRAFDPQRDLTPVSMVVINPRVFVVHPSVAANSIKELVAMARAKPGAVRYGSSGVGTGPHLAAALLASMAKVDMTHVPYKGVAPAITDLLAGQIQMIASTVSSAMPQIQGNKLRPLAVTTVKRSGALPNVPTVAESGIDGYEATAWSMLMVPAGTPRALVARIHESTLRVLDNADVRKRFAADGGEATSSSGAEAAKFLQAEIQRWAKVIKDAGVRAE
ncbi:MAG: tripartite tricarboxylate transporter substrate binding protein, partial [Burkholderiales bacterium]